MAQQRVYYTSEERTYLKELVLSHKNIIECKQTDKVTPAKKKKVWATIAEQFNSVAEHTARTPDQLKKCWENIKNRKKNELREEKQQRMATGGGVYNPPTKVDDDVDITPFVDIEIKGAIDSDTVVPGAGSTTEYILGSDNVLILQEAVDTEQGVENSQVNTTTNETPRKTESTGPLTERRTHYSRGTAIDKELNVRLERVAELRKQESELHQSRMRQEALKEKEAELKRDEAQVRLDIAKLELEELKKKYLP
ncbi:hypothetical protein RI129_002724 [Pyrocoelia pectoralis]|uniref:Regulatory protein zeste n=1 Tax=Pyrocoelia pectoralis TaxID=417401 RepID=A0AAN7V9R8_9COLE